MTLEKKFNTQMKRWERHVAHGRGPSGIQIKYSSFMSDVYDCSPCRKIAEMGEEVLPLVRKEYDKDYKKSYPLQIIQAHGLISLVRSIVGDDFNVPEEIQGRISKMMEYTKSWLDKNMHNYCIVE